MDSSIFLTHSSISPKPILPDVSKIISLSFGNKILPLTSKKLDATGMPIGNKISLFIPFSINLFANFSLGITNISGLVSFQKGIHS